MSEVPLDDDEVVIDGFETTLDGDTVHVTAVLERTCVYADQTGDRRLASKKGCLGGGRQAANTPPRRRLIPDTLPGAMSRGVY